ncbi:MAG: pyridoxamine 5'-phosphate oxidase family protein [Clostridia bacterium]|nr:pyridoxamine 5'-phosphate oxidase family protein [Clostridia bacterium]MBR0408447.1 pyridoxamine 5'-phosphate oxidase family protein [Clostridia bacterium]
MFREIKRIKQKLSDAECVEILKEEKRGVLSVQGDDGYPYGLPINHYYNEADGCLYFHSGKVGHKIDAIRRCDKASFCAYDQGFRKDGEWALNIKSVIVFGRIEIIEDQETIYDISRKLSYKFTRDEAYIDQEIARSGPRTLMFRLRPEHMTGKLVNES